MGAQVRVGVVDSGCSAAQARRVGLAAAFVLDGDVVCRTQAIDDVLAHGTRIVDIIEHCAPQAEVVVAQVFRERLATTARQVAAAIDWLVENDVTVINLSLGLREPRPVLEAACERALEAGVVLCAAAPARGLPVYPAAFAGVLGVTGDARCARMEFAALAAAHADFGAHVRALGEGLTGAGASMACAHLSGHVARFLDGLGSMERSGPDRLDAARTWLLARARYHGIEQRLR
jgi:subtilisin family serine protease